MQISTNYHTHCTFCDGKSAAEEMVNAALERGFTELGFSSHSMLPFSEPGTMDEPTARAYVGEIRRLADAYADRIKIWCGIEADYLAGVTVPDRPYYASFGLDYLIGSIHYVGKVPVDHNPQLLADGIREHFGGDVGKFIRAYFAAEREMVSRYDFDIVGHPDLIRKFNQHHPYFDESAAWYREELQNTAECIAASGKIVEINTGAIARGWLTEAYPSPYFLELLQSRNVPLLLSSDAHNASAIDYGFDRYASMATLDRLPTLPRPLRP